jgi:hypothetical protein
MFAAGEVLTLRGGVAMGPIQFDDATIEQLFGSEAADYEDIERLKKYYVKGTVYERVTADLPVRILVGHKGIGKSALIRFAMQEDYQAGVLPVLIRPDDVAGIAMDNVPFLSRLQDWKHGLVSVIAHKAISDFYVGSAPSVQLVGKPVGSLTSLVLESAKRFLEKVGVSDDPGKRAIAQAFLRTGKIRVYVDDLDRGWAAKRDEINRISTLLSAILDLCNEMQGLQFRVALRSDVYFLYRTSDESTDKTESSVVWFGWTNHDILVLLVARIESFFGRRVDQDALRRQRQHDLAKYLLPVMEPYFKGGGKWENAPMYRILMSLIRRRPRDLVKLCTLAARKSYERRSRTINTEDFQSVFEEYSQGRAQDTYNEYRSELPAIQRLIEGMRPTTKETRDGKGWIYSTDELSKKLKTIVEQGKFMAANGVHMGPRDLAQFLYKINFLIARKDSEVAGLIDRRYFEENRYLSSEFRDFGFDWEVHPAFRWHLQPERVHDIFKSLALSKDD